MPNTTPHRPACATGKDIIAQALVRHWSLPSVMDGNVVWVRCGAEDCDFQSSSVGLVGEEGAWAEHAYHVADQLELAGIGELEHPTTVSEEDEAGAPRHPLDKLKDAVMRAAEVKALVHAYARAANTAGYSWDEISSAAGLNTAQAAHWRWGRGEAPASAAASVGTESATSHVYQVMDTDWMTAAALGRKLDKDPRTIREMAARGELAKRDRPCGKDGRRRDLFRATMSVPATHVSR